MLRASLSETTDTGMYDIKKLFDNITGFMNGKTGYIQIRETQ